MHKRAKIRKINEEEDKVSNPKEEDFLAGGEVSFWSGSKDNIKRVRGSQVDLFVGALVVPYNSKIGS